MLMEVTIIGKSDAVPSAPNCDNPVCGQPSMLNRVPRMG